MPRGLELSLGSVQAILRYEHSELDYRIKLIRAASEHTRRGIVEMPVSGAPPPSAKDRPPWTVVLALVLAACAVTGSLVWQLKPGGTRTDAAGTKRMSIALGDAERYATRATGSTLALSANGKRLVFKIIQQGEARAQSLSLEDRTLAPVKGVRGSKIALSPDGEWAVFDDSLTPTRVKKVRLPDGEATTVFEAGGWPDFAWGPDGAIVYGSGTQRGLMRASADAGNPAPITSPPEDEYHKQPAWVPDRDALVFTIGIIDPVSSPNDSVAALDLVTGEYEEIVANASSPRVTPSGHLLFYRNRSLWAMAFDPDGLTPRSDAIPVVNDVAYWQNAHYGVADDGTLAYLSGASTPEPGARLVWVDRAGREEYLPLPARQYATARVAPDGDRIVAAVRDPDDVSAVELWLYTESLGTFSRFTFGGLAFGPFWSPDGKHIGFSGRAKEDATSEPLNLHLRAADGTGRIERLTTAKVGQASGLWAADGGRILWTECEAFRCRIASTAWPSLDEPTFLPIDATAWGHGLSPDGHWLVYGTYDSGYQIFVRPFPDVEAGSWEVSDGWGRSAGWSPRGDEIFYVGPKGMMAVPVDTTSGFMAGRPEPLFGWKGYALRQGRTWDIHPDGDRFLIVKPEARVASGSEPQLIVVTNWFEELERLVPTGQ